MLRRDDAVENLRERLLSHLRQRDPSVSVRIDEALDASIAWRPHVIDDSSHTAWYCLSETPATDFWATRISAATNRLPELHVGVCVPENVLYSDDEVLRRLVELGVQVATTDTSEQQGPVKVSASAADVIYEQGLRLSRDAAAPILDHLLGRCIAEENKHRKGVALEVLTAVLLSQVDGFRVTARGVSNRSQQIDVYVHNRNVAGVLGGSEIVIAEAKNWTMPVGTTEYASVYRKVETRFGRSRLGFFVTTDHFTRGVNDERRRDSRSNVLIVPLDKASLPDLWRGSSSRKDDITSRLEEKTLEAASL